jgi:hypothetical protein
VVVRIAPYRVIAPQPLELDIAETRPDAACATVAAPRGASAPTIPTAAPTIPTAAPTIPTAAPALAGTTTLLR